jgi:hypothetical protein
MKEDRHPATTPAVALADDVVAELLAPGWLTSLLVMTESGGPRRTR